MNFVRFKYQSLIEVSRYTDISSYQSMVKPLTYDFGVSLNISYVLLGLVVQNNTLWAYVIPQGWPANDVIDLVPAVLLESFSIALTGKYTARLSANATKLELLPTSLAMPENWFERYCDNDQSIQKLIVEFISG